MEFAVTKHISN